MGSRSRLLLCTLLLLFAGAVHAQGYPARTIRFIVPGPPSGATDILARIVGQKLAEGWGKQVVVENLPGAGGTVGTGVAAKSPPDGYTITMGHAGTHAIAVSLYRRLSYDPLRDFAPITLVAVGPNVLLVHPSLPVKSVKELIAFARVRPGQLNYASGGIGLGQHLSGELFKHMAGIDIVHVPYRGSAPALVDLLTGQVSLMFPNIPASLPHIQSGKLRALAVTSARRSALMPQLPTVSEAGLAGYEATAWFGVFAPAGTPKDVVAKLNAQIVKIIQSPDVRALITRQGMDVVGNSPDEFATHVRAEITKWAKVVKESGARAD
ncbi:MAG: tripartite tricarboxylate transporter substrate binding protein [Betaproteobacteria bacterium]|nr:tripartite tricarboxylate transporter substrate binding protein [Betaproteobacteria bacterium]